MDPLKELRRYGQSYWLDNLTRALVREGELERRVRDQDLRGVTSNPKIFHEAIANSSDYDAQIAESVAQGLDTEQVYERLVVTDVRQACDVLRPVYDASGGVDGFVSLEVSPHLAHDAEATIAEAKRLFAEVARDNCFIKIPGTTEGLRAIEEALYEGVNVNVTLLFSVQRYEAVAETYMRALERRLEQGRDVQSLRSVASFFLSRIDVLVDQLLSQRIRPRHPSEREPRPEQLLGKAGVANAKLAYTSFSRFVSSERWKALARRGASPQRVLWASTSTKNPDYSDVMYVEPLIGPHTVNTMPERTIAAFSDHGQPGNTIGDGIEGARQVMRDLERTGIDLDLVTAQLENEGVQKFIDPYDDLLTTLAKKGRQHSRSPEVVALEKMADQLRATTIRMTTRAGSGHPTSCMSCADLVSALFFHQMRWDPTDPHARDVDQLVLSKGHAAPILWAALGEAGAIDEDPMTLRQIDSTLEGHPTPRNPWVRVATGSLGQGLSAANGIALANRLDGIDTTLYCLLGDGECSEGSVWEAAQFAALNGLSNVVAIVDDNALGQSDPTPYGHHAEVFAQRFAAFGWHTIAIDGHDMQQILGAFYEASMEPARPVAIIARTIKGKGVSFLAGKEGWHGKALDQDQMQRALSELGDAGTKIPVTPRRTGRLLPTVAHTRAPIELDYERGDEVATRDGYGSALEKLGESYPELVVLDGDVKNSTRTLGFAKKYPTRFFEGYIAEQNLAGVALGLASSGKIANFATFSAFLGRAADFIRMAAHSRPGHLIFTGSHAGISIGEDGPSQMGLEDIALFRALADSTVLYPSDAVSAERLTEIAMDVPGIVYLRTTRPKTPVIYGNEELFEVGGSKVLERSDRDELTIVAAGITVHEALAAHESLRQQGMHVRVIDAYSVKPLDVDTLREAARATGKLLVVEDHWYEGGLGDAVAAALDIPVPVHRLAVTREPRSGSKQELLDRYGLSRRAIAEKALRLRG